MIDLCAERIGFQLEQGCRATATALIKEDNVPLARIEIAAVTRTGAGAGAAMDEQDRRRLGVARAFIEDPIPLSREKGRARIRLKSGKQGRHQGHSARPDLGIESREQDAFLGN